MTSREAMPEMRDLLIERLEEADYPVGDIEISDRGADSVEIIATLVSTAVDPEEIDAVTSYMEDQRDIASATWEGSTKD